MPEFVVEFQPIGRRGLSRPGDTLLTVAQEAGVEIVSLCGGVGACDSCRVRLLAGRLTPPTLADEDAFSAAELDAGWRLACQAEPLADVKIDIPPESLTTPQRLQIEGQENELDLDPVVTAVDLDIPAPSLSDLRDDWSRLNESWCPDGSRRLAAAPALLASLSNELRAQDWRVRLAVRAGNQLAAILPRGAPLLGLAVDVGTTSIAAYLVDLQSGAILARGGVMNPQIAYGEDVISRIVFANERPGGRPILRERLVHAVNELTSALCVEAGAEVTHIVEAVVVGNTAMHHIFAGLGVRQLGEAPYVPAVSAPLDLPAAGVGLDLAPGATVYMPPIIAGYVGADHVAMLLSSGVWRAAETAMAIDIGTNTEVSLVHEGRHFCCSCASGPAFEGAHIAAGMRAAPGAIERVQWQDGALRLKTIGDQKPVGLCGSGILDAAAVMVHGDIVDRRGALQRHHPLVRTDKDGKPAFVLVSAQGSGHGHPVLLSRGDIAEIQLAKGAIRSGIEILLMEAGIEAGQIRRFVIAGAFGTYINVDSAMATGMFPELPRDRFEQVGNAAGMGARQFLVSSASRRQAAAMVERIDYVELTVHQGFQELFMRYMAF